MRITKKNLIKLIREQISKEEKDIYEVDYVKGDYEYHSFGPSRTTWENFWTRKGRDKHDFGKFASPQAAKKQFLIRFPREKNYYWSWK